MAKHAFFLWICFAGISFSLHAQTELLLRLTPASPALPAGQWAALAPPPGLQMLWAQLQAAGVQRIRRPFETLSPGRLRGAELIASLRRTYAIALPAGADANIWAARLQELPEVELAEAAPVPELFYTPNDPGFAQQWNLAKIRADLAWNFARGSAGVTVAIVDDAVLLQHDDLLPVIWTNPGEIAGNGIDDDGNGYIDDIHGWDAADNDNNPSPPAAATNNVFSHGTHCAGIAAAATDNGTGIASIGFGVRIMAVKCSPDANLGPSLPNGYDGVVYAIAAGADVISMSWGGAASSQTYQNLFFLAHLNDIVCVAAAGNSNVASPMYPASYLRVISVAASDPNDLKAGFSNFGPNIDLTAPGVSIYSSVAGSTNSYGNKSGTSMACPLVAGLAALMRSFDPTASAGHIENCLKQSAINIDGLNPAHAGQLGAGRIDALNAISCFRGAPIPRFTANPANPCPGFSVQFGDSSLRSPTGWLWRFPGGLPASSSLQHPVVNYPNPGLYSVTLIVSNALGQDSLTLQQYVQVAAPTAQISGGGIGNAGTPFQLRFDFSGPPPYDVVYTDGTNNFPINGITANPLFWNVTPAASSTYSLLSFQTAQCAGTVSGQAQVLIVGGCGASVNFQKIFGGDNYDQALSVIQTPDCGYLVGGQTFSFGTGLWDAFMAKLTPQGQIDWMRTYGAGNDASIFSKVLAVSNGYIGAGSRGVTNVGQMYLVKTDLQGNVQWTQHIQTSTGGGSTWSNVEDLRELPNGDLILTGFGGSPSYFNQTGQMAARLNGATGAITWFQVMGLNNYEAARELRLLPNNEAIMAGESRSAGVTAGLYDFSLTRFNTTNGAIVWSRNYGGPLNENANALCLTPDGGYLMAGTTEGFGATQRDILLVKTNGAGVFQWAMAYDGGMDDIAWSIAPDCRNGYYVAATSRDPDSQNDILVFRINNSGQPLWAQRIGGVMNDGERLELNATGDCGFVLAGSTQSFGQGLDDVWLIKADSLGQLSCHARPLNLPSRPVVLSTSIVSLPISVAHSLPTLATVELPAIPIVVDSVCQACPAPSADFEYAVNRLTVTFFNRSTGATHYHWDFGDGNQDTLRKAVHRYAAPGSYSVRLIAFNNCRSDTIIKQIIINGANSCTQVLQPGPQNGKDATVFSRDDTRNTNSGANAGLWAATWTWSGNPGTMRTYMQFDFSDLCPGALLRNAELSLQHDATFGQPHSGANVSFFDPVGAPWDEYGITWLNQPVFGMGGMVMIPAQAGVTPLLNLPVTPLIQQLINGPNYGFVWRLQTEATYRRVVYCSSDHPDPAMRPKLELSFDPVSVQVGDANGAQRIDICKGDSVRLFANVFHTATGPSGPSLLRNVKWIPAEGLNCDTCINPWAKPGKTVTYRAVVYGCEACAESDTVQVVVNEVEIASQSIILCPGDSARLEASVPAGLGNVLYQWTPATGLNNPNLRNPLAAPAASTTYVVRVSLPLGCDATDSATVFISGRPGLPRMSPDTTICLPFASGDSLLYWRPSRAFVPIGSDFYTWSPAGFFPIDIHDPNATARIDLRNPAARYRFRLQVVNADGCVSEDSALLQLQYCIIQNTSLCAGSSLQVGNRIYTQSGIYTDTLRSTSGLDSIVTSSLLILPPLQTSQQIALCEGDSLRVGIRWYRSNGNYVDTLKNAAGCDSVVQTALQMLPLPVPSVSGIDSLCEGETLMLQADGGVAYSWRGPNGFFSTTARAAVADQATPAMSGRYTVTVTGANGCSSSAGMEVYVGETPRLLLQSKQDAYCDRRNARISVAASGGLPPYRYRWLPGAAQTPDLQNLSPGSYRVFLRDALGCADSLEVSVGGAPAPIASFYYEPDSSIALFEGETVRFTNTSQNAAAYAWSFGDGLSSNQFHPAHQYLTSGRMKILLIAYDTRGACPDTARQWLDIGAKGKLFIPNAFSPNGDGHNDWFEVKGEGIGAFECVIFNRWGREIIRLNSIAERWDGRHNGVSVPEGVYVYRLRATGHDGRQYDHAGSITVIR